MTLTSYRKHLWDFGTTSLFCDGWMMDADTLEKAAVGASLDTAQSGISTAKAL